MGSRAEFVLLLVFVINYAYTDARSLENLSIIDTLVDSNITRSESKDFDRSGKSGQLCILCEEFTAQAISYLCENKTQTEIINALHKTCSRLRSYEQQCILLVNYYAPIFFVEIATIHPEDFCKKVNLCEGMLLVQPLKNENACMLCHHVIDEVLTKLKDPETQLELIEIILKGCNKVENFVQECKKLVFQYGPLILANTEKFLEKTDVCAVIYGCKASQELLLDQKLLVDA